MALLTIVDAVRLTGVSRAQLYRYLKAGRISRTPDGFLDTAELLRAGLMLQLRDETVPVSMTHNETELPVSRETAPVSPVSTAHIQALERLIEVLQREVDAVRERETTLLREAHERETLLLQMLSQVQQQNQRLLDMPRQPAQEAAHAPQPLSRVRSYPPRQDMPTATPDASGPAPRGTMRRRIVALLQDYPEGLTTREIQAGLGSLRSLTDTVLAMRRDGLLRRVAHGRYAVAEL
jgi:hypothetical protein